MNLRMRRLVRTASSEQYALFDLDQTGGEDGAPTTIGKLDLHYTAEGLYGTLLLWDDETAQLSDEQREDFVYTLLDELSLPMGVPNEYVVEFFAPELDKYSVFHNVGLAADADQEDYDEIDSEPVAQVDTPSVDGSAAGDDVESNTHEAPEGLREPLPDFDVKPVD